MASEDQKCGCLRPNRHQPPTADDPWFKLPDEPSFMDRVTHARKRYSVFVSTYPVSFCAVLVILQLLFTALAFIPGALNTGDAAAASPGQISAIGELAVRQNMALDAAYREEEAEGPLKEPLTESARNLLMVFTAKGDDLWTVDAMANSLEILEALQGKRKLDGYEIEDFEDYCYMTPDPHNDGELRCSLPLAAVYYVLFPDVALGYAENKTEITVEDVRALTDADVKERALEKLQWAKKPSSAPAEYQFVASTALMYFDKEISLNYNENTTTAADMKGRFMQSILFWGGPLKGTKNGKQKFRNSDDDPVEQDRLFREWAAPQYLPFLQHLEGGTDEFEGFHWWENNLGGLTIQEMINRDLTLTAVAGSIIVVVIAVQTGATAYAVIAVLFVAWTYPCGLVIFHGIYGLQVSPQLNQLALFSLLGIGSDNALLVLNAFFQSFAEPDFVVGKVDEPYKRLDYVLWRAFSSASIANFTTVIAFALTSLSPLPVVAAFGQLASAMIICLFVGTMTYLIALTEVWFSVWNAHLVCCCMRKSDPRQYLADSCAKSAYSVSATTPNPAGAPQLARVPSEERPEEDMSQYRVVEKFFYTIWSPLIYRARYVLFACIFVFIAVGGWGTSLLAPPNEEGTALPEESNLNILIEEKLPEFEPASLAWGGTRVFMVWGINAEDPLDREGLDPNDEFHLGTVQYTDFPIHELATLRVLEGACSIVKNYRFDEKAEDTDHDPSMKIVDDSESPVACTPTAFLEWEAAQRNTTAANLTESDWDFTPESFALRLKNDYLPNLRASADTTDQVIAGSWFGLAPTNPKRVRAMYIASNSTIPFQATRAALRRHVEGWYDAMDEVNEYTSDAGLDTKGYVTQWFFSYYRTTTVMVQATYESMAITYVIAIACVLIATSNYIITAIVALNLAAVVLLVIAIFSWIGLHLSWTESILLSILVGLIVDPVTHIAAATSFSKFNGRFERTRYALLEIGVSVLGGAATSLVPNLILLGAVFPFFSLFGRVTSIAVGTAAVAAFTILPASLMILGPETYHSGNIISLIHGISNSSTSKKVSTDETDDVEANPNKKTEESPAVA